MRGTTLRTLKHLDDVALDGAKRACVEARTRAAEAERTLAAARSALPVEIELASSVPGGLAGLAAGSHAARRQHVGLSDAVASAARQIASCEHELRVCFLAAKRTERLAELRAAVDRVEAERRAAAALDELARSRPRTVRSAARA